MNISLDFVTHAMKPILGFLNKPPAQAAAFIESVHKTCYWMKADRFQKVCEKLAMDMPEGGKTPGYSKFRAVYNELSDTHNWRAHDQANRKPCTSCKDFGWVNITLYNPKLGETDKFLKPCPECRKDHPVLNSPLLDGWVETTEKVTRPREPSFNPGMSRFLASLYEDFDPSGDAKTQFEQFLSKKRGGTLKQKKVVKSPFMEALNALEVGRPAERAAQEGPGPLVIPSAASLSEESQTGGSEPTEDSVGGGDLPPF